MHAHCAGHYLILNLRKDASNIHPIGNMIKDWILRVYICHTKLKIFTTMAYQHFYIFSCFFSLSCFIVRLKPNDRFVVLEVIVIKYVGQFNYKVNMEN